MGHLIVSNSNYSGFMTPFCIVIISLPGSDEFVQYIVSSMSRLPPTVGFSLPMCMFKYNQNILTMRSLESNYSLFKFEKHNSIALYDML